MRHYEIITLQRPSDKVARINVENLTKLPGVGFPPGQAVNIKYYPDLRKIVVESSTEGSHVISKKNYKYKDGVRIGSRLDLRNETVAEIFEGETELMMIYSDNKLVFCETPRSKSVRERIIYLGEAVTEDKEIKTASLFAGVGCADIGAEDGFMANGIKTKLMFMNELESKFVDTFTNNNKTYKKGSTVTAAMDMHQLFPAAIPDVHLWSAGIVCKSFSSLNVKHRDAPEFDENFGHLTTSTLMTLQMTQFKSPIIFIEQVVPYFNSSSFSQLKRILEIKGYTLHLAGDFKNDKYKGVAGADYGDIENRKRLFAAFVTNGVNIDLNFMDERARKNATPIKEFLDAPETIPEKAYSIGSSLKKKSLETDWSNRVVSDQVTSFSTISAGYGRVRIEDPKLLRDNDNTLGDFRLFTASEVARFKQLPEDLVDGVSAKKDQYTMLGNGLNGGASTAFFYAIAKSLTALSQPWDDKLKQAV